MKKLVLVLLAFSLAVGAVRAQTGGAATIEPKAFFYTAVWDETADNITPDTLQRIEMTSTQYDEAKNKFMESFVTQLTAAAKPGAAGAAGAVAPAPTPGANGAAAPAAAKAEIHLSLDPKKPTDETPATLVYAFDAATQQGAVAAGNDPHTLAEWAFFYWQELLWENYVSRGALLLPDVMASTDLDNFVKTMNTPRTPIWSWTEVDAKTSEPKDWTQSNKDFPKGPTPTDQETAAETSLKTQAGNAGGKLLDPQIPAEADNNLAGLYFMYREAAYALDCSFHDQYWGVMGELHDRQDTRSKYAEWLNDRQDQVQQYAKDWARKYDGTEFNVDGVQFLVSQKKPVENPPSNLRNIVIDKKVVPYDLLNADGTLKRPEKTAE